MNIGESVKLIGMRWKIFEKLSEKEYYVSELAKELRKSPPEISKNLKDLEKVGLVECKQKEGQKLKYCHISDYANKILTAINQVTPLKPKKSLDDWQMNEFLNILEDQNLSDDVRLFYSNSFQCICSDYPTEVINHKRVQRLFEKVAADPFYDKVREGLMRSLSVILRKLRHKEGTNWALKKLYPIFVRKMEDEAVNQEIRVWVTRQIGNIAGSSMDLPKRIKVEKKFLDIWYDDNTDPESDLGKKLEQQLVDLASRRLFENVRAKATDKNPEVKTKAEILLKRLKECLMPK